MARGRPFGIVRGLGFDDDQDIFCGCNVNHPRCTQCTIFCGGIHAGKLYPGLTICTVCKRFNDKRSRDD